jgi:hypothetical protein
MPQELILISASQRNSIFWPYSICLIKVHAVTPIRHNRLIGRLAIQAKSERASVYDQRSFKNKKSKKKKQKNKFHQ